MDYEKAYKEALERARKIHNEHRAQCFDVMVKVFPELEESKDEKIRKGLIQHLQELRNSHVNLMTKDTYDSWIAWLEKQGEQKPVGGNERETEINLVEILKHYPRETELYSPLYGKLWLAEVDEEHEIITCYKHHLDEGCTRAILEQEDTVSFYSNGTIGLPDFNVSEDCMLFLYGREKQGEQKENQYITITQKILDYIGKYESSFENDIPKLGDVWNVRKICTYPGVNNGKPIVEIENDKGAWMRLPLYVVDFTRGDSPVLSNSSNVRKNDDNVEPKFKVGDWIVRSAEGFKHNTYLVINVKDHYSCEDLNGRRVTFTFNDVHKNFKLWDISDAKDGDVLVDEDNNIGIYKEIELIYWHSYIYLGCDSKLRGFYIGGSHKQTDTCPAIKEQRDILMKAMADAGYEWNFEKKELEMKR